MILIHLVRQINPLMMKSNRNYTFGTVYVLVLFAFIQSCSFLKEISTLGKCEFRMGTLEQPFIAGIDVSKIHNFTDLTLVDVGIVGASVMRGELPLSFTLNVEARNGSQHGCLAAP